MTTRIGDKIAEIDDGGLWDSALTVEGEGRTFKTLEESEKNARHVASSAIRDAAIVQFKDGYKVVSVAEMDLGAATGRSLNEASPKLVAVVSGLGSGVRVRGATDGTSQIDRVAQVFVAAGLPEEKVARMTENGVTPQEADELLLELLNTPPSLHSFGQRRLAMMILDRARAKPHDSSPTMLLAQVKRMGKLVVARPDGYLVQLSTGEPRHKMGESRYVKGDDGERWMMGAFQVGALYGDSGGVFFAVDENLRQVGPPLGEKGLQGVTGPVGTAAEGVAEAVVGCVQGLAHLILHPIDSVEALAQLPDQVRVLLENSDAYRDQFLALPLEEQTRVVARIITELALIGAGGAGAAKTVGNVGRNAGRVLLPMPAPVLQANGALAYGAITVNVAKGAAAVQGGPGALYAMHMAAQGTPSQAPKGASDGLPREVNTAKGVEKWLKANGFTKKAQKGSHAQWVGPTGHKVTVPIHGGTIKVGTLASIRRQILAALGVAN